MAADTGPGSGVLDDYEPGEFTHDGKTRTVFRRGDGPAVLVIAEMPGISPKVVEFADRVAATGCTAVLPHLFGDAGRDATKMPGGALYAVSSLVPACVSREFSTFALGRTSPVVNWLRALAASEHQRCGGPGVGAVGMCFTGGFALGMAVDDRMLAPVLSQPSLPFGATKSRKRAIDISAEDLAVVRGRCDRDGLKVLGLRFEGDAFCPGERFDALRTALGDAFVAVELPPESAAKGAAMKPHSVLTEHLVDEPGEPTRDALDQVLAFFRDRLLTPT
jgi:dienelactone hydrolase